MVEGRKLSPRTLNNFVVINSQTCFASNFPTVRIFSFLFGLKYLNGGARRNLWGGVGKKASKRTKEGDCGGGLEGKKNDYF